MALMSRIWGEAENGPRPTPDPRVSAVVPAMGVTVQLPMACPRLPCARRWRPFRGAQPPRCGRGHLRVDPAMRRGGLRPAPPLRLHRRRPLRRHARDALDLPDHPERVRVRRGRAVRTPSGRAQRIRLRAEHVDDAEAIIAWPRTMLRDGIRKTLEPSEAFPRLDAQTPVIGPSARSRSIP